jgi:hypothetical protein
MKHFYEKIEGWWGGPSDDQLYREVVKYNEDGAHFVEVGSWAGRSACQMAVNIINSEKNIKFDCVDTWEGSEDGAEHKSMDVVKEGKLYDLFLKNTKRVKHVVNPIRKPSVEAAKLYEDQSLDFVFLDADHSYKSVTEDLNAWFPKLKPGAIFAGHDFNNPLFGVREAVENFFTEKGLPFDLCGVFWEDPEIPVRMPQHRGLSIDFDAALWYVDLSSYEYVRSDFVSVLPAVQSNFERQCPWPMWRGEHGSWTNSPETVTADGVENWRKFEPEELILVTDRKGNILRVKPHELTAGVV